MAPRRLRILLAEDDDYIRNALIEAVSPVHDVIATRNAPQAIEEIQKAGSHFDCLVTDFNMPPHESGAAVVRAFLGRFPSMPAIMISAHIVEGPFAAEELIALRQEIPSLAFLPKPFAYSELLKTIAQLRGVVTQ